MPAPPTSEFRLCWCGDGHCNLGSWNAVQRLQLSCVPREGTLTLGLSKPCAGSVDGDIGKTKDMPVAMLLAADGQRAVNTATNINDGQWLKTGPGPGHTRPDGRGASHGASPRSRNWTNMQRAQAHTGVVRCHCPWQTQPPEMWELLRHPRWRTNYTCLQEAADRTRPKMDPSKVWTLRMQNKAAAAREAQKKDDDAAGLGCGTGELQRADLQAEERRQQQADKRQKAEEARANQERQVVLMEDQMDALELAAETSERTFKKTVQEVLNAYSRINGKARNPGKDAEMTAEIQMI